MLLFTSAYYMVTVSLPHFRSNDVVTFNSMWIHRANQYVLTNIHAVKFKLYKEKKHFIKYIIRSPSSILSCQLNNNTALYKITRQTQTYIHITGFNYMQRTIQNIGYNVLKTESRASSLKLSTKLFIQMTLVHISNNWKENRNKP